MPTFMHLGVFAAQARAVSIVARAPCVIWLLERSATRAVLGKRAWDALPYLRRVNLLACMSLGQLDRVVVSMRPKVFGPNETIVKRGGDSVFGVVAQGEVRRNLLHCVQLPHALLLSAGQYCVLLRYTHPDQFSCDDHLVVGTPAGGRDMHAGACTGSFLYMLVRCRGHQLGWPQLQVHCKISDPGGGPSTHISLSEGDYFGELALQGSFKSASSLQADQAGAWAMSLREEEFSNCCGALKDLIAQA